MFFSTFVAGMLLWKCSVQSLLFSMPFVQEFSRFTDCICCSSADWHNCGVRHVGATGWRVAYKGKLYYLCCRCHTFRVFYVVEQRQFVFTGSIFMVILLICCLVPFHLFSFFESAIVCQQMVHISVRSFQIVQNIEKFWFHSHAAALICPRRGKFVSNSTHRLCGDTDCCTRITQKKNTLTDFDGTNLEIVWVVVGLGRSFVMENIRGWDHYLKLANLKVC